MSDCKNAPFLKCILILFVVSFILPCHANARQTIVNGSLSAGIDYVDRSYDDDFEDTGDNGDAEDLFIGPEIELVWRGIHDELFFRYAPTLVYDNINSETDIDHFLSTGWTWQATRQWLIEISNDFVFAEDPDRFGAPFEFEATEEDEEPPQLDEITRNIGRSRFYTNALELATTYLYAAESDINVGYGYRILRDDSDGTEPQYDEYDRHNVFGNLNHRFNAYWSSSVGLEYEMGLFEEDTDEGLSADLDEYRVSLGVTYTKDPRNSFPALYTFEGTQYEDDRADVRFHELTLGWDHEFDIRTSITMGAGPSYAESDDLDGELGFNGFIIYSKRYQHSNLTASVRNSYNSNNFTGSDDTGLTDTTSVSLDFTHQITNYLASSVFVEYTYERNVNPTGNFLDAALEGEDPESQQDIDDVEYVTEGYRAGASLDYSFWRDFLASLSYIFYKQEGDAEQIGDSYTDHRVTLTISVARELWR